MSADCDTTEESSGKGRNVIWKGTLVLILTGLLAWEGWTSTVSYQAGRLDHQDSQVRIEAARALERMGPEAEGAIPELIEALDSPDPDVRRAVVRTLGAMEEAAEPAVPALVEELRGEAFAGVVGFSSSRPHHALARIGRAGFAPFLEDLDHPDVAIRVDAARMVGRMLASVRRAGDQPEVAGWVHGPLMARLEDPAPSVRYQALKALEWSLPHLRHSDMRNEAARSLVEFNLRLGNGGAEALWALAARDPESVVTIIEEQLESETAASLPADSPSGPADLTVRVVGIMAKSEAMHAFGQAYFRGIGEPALVAMLGLLEDSDLATSRAALVGLTTVLQTVKNPSARSSAIYPVIDEVERHGDAVAAEAGATLAAVGPPALRRLLVLGFPDAPVTPALQYSARTALVEMVQGRDRTAKQDAVLSVLGILNDSSRSAEDRRQATLILAGVDDGLVLTSLLAALGDEDVMLRRQAASAVVHSLRSLCSGFRRGRTAEISSKGEVQKGLESLRNWPLLLAAIDDSSPEVRVHALRAAGLLASMVEDEEMQREATERLLEQIKESGPSEGTTIAAAEALGWVLEALRELDAELEAAIAEAVPHLATHLEAARQAESREILTRTLVRIGTPEAVGTVRRAGVDPNQVRAPSDPQR